MRGNAWNLGVFTAELEGFTHALFLKGHILNFPLLQLANTIFVVIITQFALWGLKAKSYGILYFSYCLEISLKDQK